MVRWAYTGREPVAAKIVRAVEEAENLHEGERGMERRIDRITGGWREEHPDQVAHFAADIEREYARKNGRMDRMLQYGMPDEWIARLLAELKGLKMAAALLMR